MNVKLLSLIGAVSVLMAACSNVCDVEQGSSGVIPGTPEDFKANVPDRVYFDFDSSKVSPAARKRLEAQACWLNTYSGTAVTVEGHTDVRGTAEYNMALGNARADSAAKVLKENGVNKDRVTVVSFGKERVAIEGTTEEDHAQNRRAVSVVCSK